MKHNILIKFLVILLTSLSILVSIACGAGIYAMESADLYANGIDSLQDQQYNSLSESIAKSYATLYAVKELGNLSSFMRDALYTDPASRLNTDYWTVGLRQDDQVLVEPKALPHCTYSKEYTVIPEYPIALYPQDTPEDSDEENSGEQPNVQTPAASAVPSGYLYRKTENFWHNNQWNSYELYYYEAPEYTVTVYLQEELLNNSSLNLLTALFPYRYTFITILAFGLIFSAVGIVYLCWSAGRSPDGSVHPGGLSLFPLDVYAAIIGGALYLVFLLYNNLQQYISYEGLHPGGLSYLGLLLLGAVLLGVAFLYSLAAQLKLESYYWWNHSLLGFLLTRLYRGLRLAMAGIRKVTGMLSILWQWLLTGLLMAAAVVVFLVLSLKFGGVFILLLILAALACAAIVCYGGYSFGILLAGVNIMSKGNLSHQIPTRYLVGSFREFALQLNALSGTARETAQKHTRSERMKTELITNVTHDIKTPLTSIINFVDLLQRGPSPEDTRQYLQILSRQSLQMKRLIDDLIELSKAASGSLTVNLAPMDAAETVNQALGEFSDKLDSAQLDPVFRSPAEPVEIRADGRLVWRVLGNLLSNAVKYAMPGTRLYVDLSKFDDTVLLSIKNISRQSLNTSAEDLMERFVQGDSSRSTDGSGLGLNIAKTLMELMGGKLQILIDGDLFKVTLVFPAA